MTPQEIGMRAIAERQREIAVSLKALHLMQEHYGNRYIGFKCVREDEEREWHAKADKLIPQVGELPCKNESKYVNADGSCIRCGSDQGVACRKDELRSA